MEETQIIQLDATAVSEAITSQNEVNTEELNPDAIMTSAYAAMLKSQKVANIDKLMEINDTINQRITIIGDIDDETGTTVDAFIRMWNSLDDEKQIPASERQPIKILINSYGGDLNSAFTAYDAIKNSITPVYTYNIGRAYSGGFIILIAGHKRFGYKYSTYLIHEGSINGGHDDANKFHNFADFYKKRLTQLCDCIVSSTNITQEEYEDHRKDDWWLDADEALSHNIIYNIV